MCIICVDYLKGVLTAFEVRGNMREWVTDPAHRIEIELMLEKDKAKGRKDDD